MTFGQGARGFNVYNGTVEQFRASAHDGPPLKTASNSVIHRGPALPSARINPILRSRPTTARILLPSVALLAACNVPES